jgi:outer membrane protein TolC
MPARNHAPPAPWLLRSLARRALRLLSLLSLALVAGVPAAGPAAAGDARTAEAGEEEDETRGAAAGARSEGAESATGDPTTLRLSLADSVRMALESNLQIRISRVDDRIRQREVIVAKSFFDPLFTLGGSYAKNRDPTVSVLDVGTGIPSQEVAVNPSDAGSYSVGLSGDWLIGTQYDLELSQVEVDRPATSEGGIISLNPVTTTRAAADVRQPLLRGAWDVNTAEIRIAYNTARVSRDEVERIAMQTVYEVERAYWELAFANQNLEAKIKALDVTSENLENVKKKYAVGTLAAIDVTTAESQVALRKVELEEAKLLLATNRDNLLDLVNYSGERSLKERWEGREEGPYDSMTVVCASEIDLSSQPLDRDQALTLAFGRRPEYRQIALNLKSQEIRAETARNDLLPSLDLLGRWAQLGLEEDFDGSYDELGSGRYYDWFVGVEFSVPLSNRGNRSRYQNARAEAHKLRLQRSDLENQIVLEVDQTIREIRSLEQRVADLDERVRLQRLLLDAERRKLEVGKSIAYTVSTIENDLVDNFTQALRAKANLQIAKARYRMVTGTILDEHQILVEGDVEE